MDQEMSLRDLLAHMWRVKFYIICGMVLGLIAAVSFLMLVTPKYRAEMIVIPADGYALGDYASSIDYDRIAALPFWRPKDQEGASTDFYRFIHTLRGAAAAHILIKDESFLAGVNKKRDRKIETAEELSVYLGRYIKIDPLGASPLRKISYVHPDPEFAAAMLRKTHLVADQMIRRDRRRQSQSRVEYLENALRKTIHPDHRKGITNLLMQQEHIQMLANLDEAYAAIIVEPPSSSPKPVWPNRPFTIFVSVLLGLMLGYIVGSFKKVGD